MTKVEVLDFVQILFNPEPVVVSEKKDDQREGPTIRVLLSALRIAVVDATALITGLKHVKSHSPNERKKTYVGGFRFFKRRVDAPLSSRFVIAVDTIVGCRSGGYVEHWRWAEEACNITCLILRPLPSSSLAIRIHEQCWSPPTFRGLFRVRCHADPSTM